MLTALALAVACGALEALGPRPALAIDALWVNDHRPKVEVLLTALGCAALFSVPGLMVRRIRSYIVFMWVGAGVLLAVRYWERFIIIIDVVRTHTF